MLPKIWGKSAWDFTHYVTLAYPLEPTDEDQINYYNFFYSLPAILPCKKCGKSLNNHYEILPLTEEILSSRQSLVKWWVDIHNMVNRSIGKKILSYDEAAEKLHQLVQPPREKRINKWYYLLLIVVILVALFIIYFWRRR